MSSFTPEQKLFRDWSNYLYADCFPTYFYLLKGDILLSDHERNFVLFLSSLELVTSRAESQIHFKFKLRNFVPWNLSYKKGMAKKTI